MNNSAETITGIVWNPATRLYNITRTGTSTGTEFTLVHSMSATPATVICSDGSKSISARQRIT